MQAVRSFLPHVRRRGTNARKATRRSDEPRRTQVRSGNDRSLPHRLIYGFMGGQEKLYYLRQGPYAGIPYNGYFSLEGATQLYSVRGMLLLLTVQGIGPHHTPTR